MYTNTLCIECKYNWLLKKIKKWTLLDNTQCLKIFLNLCVSELWTCFFFTLHKKVAGKGEKKVYDQIKRKSPNMNQWFD